MYGLSSRLRCIAAGFADRGDDVRRRVGDAVEQHGVAHALDPGRRDDPLALQGHRLRTAGPHGVHDRLDVLLVHDRAAGLVAHGVPDLLRGVVEGDGQPRTLDRGEPGRGLQRVDVVLDLVEHAAVELTAELLDLGVERRHVGLQRLDPVGLLLGEVGEVGVLARPQVGPRRVHGTGHQQGAGPQERRRGGQPPDQAVLGPADGSGEPSGARGAGVVHGTVSFDCFGA